MPVGRKYAILTSIIDTLDTDSSNATLSKNVL